MTNTTDFQPRIDNGTYTFKTQRAADFTLESEVEVSDANSNARDFAEQVRHSDPRISREGSAALLAEVERTIRLMRHKNGLTADQAQDAVGDTMLDLTARIKKGHSLKGGLIQIAANAVCSRYVNGPVRHETAKALKLLKERVSEQEAAVGHSLTSAEIARLAEAVRTGNDFNARHRPVENFHLIQDFVRPTSFSQFPASYIDEQMQEFEYGIDREFQGMGSAADRLAEEIELNTEEMASKKKAGASKDELKEHTAAIAGAKQRIFEALAADRDIPLPTKNWVPKDYARDMTAHMTVENRVLKACRDHDNGVKSRETAALFAPFERLSADDKDNVTALFQAHPTLATELWVNALSSATSEKSSKQLTGAKA